MPGLRQWQGHLRTRPAAAPLVSSQPRWTHGEDGIQPQQIAFILFQGQEKAQQLALYEEPLGRRKNASPVGDRFQERVPGSAAAPCNTLGTMPRSRRPGMGASSGPQQSLRGVPMNTALPREQGQGQARPGTKPILTTDLAFPTQKGTNPPHPQATGQTPEAPTTVQS